WATIAGMRTSLLATCFMACVVAVTHPAPFGATQPQLAVAALIAAFGSHIALLYAAAWRQGPEALRAVTPSLLSELLVRRPALAVLGVMVLGLPADGPGLWVGLAIGLPALAFVVRGGGLYLGRLTGLVHSAPPWLVELAGDTPVELLRARSVNAFAFPQLGRVLFTTAAVEKLTAEQCARILEHEKGHLTEAPGLRMLGLPYLTAIACWRPLFAHLDFSTAVGIVVLAALPAFAIRPLSRRLESRADAHADEPGYGEALEAVYRLNLVPVVLGGRGTHPDLYDRLVSLGSPPPWPRPDPPRTRLTRLVGLLGPVVVLAPLVFLRTLDPPRPPVDDIPFWLAVGAPPLNLLIQAGDQVKTYDPPRARALFRAAHELYPGSAQALAGLAVTEQTMGDQEAAEAAAAEADRILMDGNPDAWTVFMLSLVR
ncbi:MAG: M48 family metalloprotease, partial [Myxococcales bacterium]|nr:M48 family metalloprotease [Myxococcales bacterium]